MTLRKEAKERLGNFLDPEVEDCGTLAVESAHEDHPMDSLDIPASPPLVR